MSDIEKKIVPKIEPKRRETELGMVEPKQQKKRSEEVLLEEAKAKDSEVKKVLAEKVDEVKEVETGMGKGKMLWVWMGVFVVALVVGLLGLMMYVGNRLHGNEEVTGQKGPRDEINTSGESRLADVDNRYFLVGGELGEWVRIITWSLSEKRGSYEKFTMTGCPGPCGGYVADLERVDREYSWLEEVSNRKICVLTGQDKEEFDENFGLFAGGIERKYEIEGVEIKGLDKCGVRYVAYDGFDTGLSNYYYRLAVVDGEFLVKVELPLYPRGAMERVDGLYEKLKFQGNECDSWCGREVYDYLENVDFGFGVEAGVIEEYDGIVEGLERAGKEE